MKKYFLFSVLLIVAFAAVAVFAQESMSEELQVSTTHVETHPSQGDIRIIEGGSATIMTNEEGLFASFVTDELEENHVYTMWVVIVNNPDACETFPCTPAEIIGNSDALLSEATWTDSMIYTEDARQEFYGYVPAGDVHEPWFGNGLTNPMGAEIHIVINDHGEYIPELGPSMVNTYRGGCTDESLPPPFPDTAKSDGEPGANACQLIQDAIFKQ